MSNPLGNGAIVETSDEKIIVLQRSNNVGESPGHYVFPGGHSEPQEVGILAHQNDEKDVAGLTERISDEMFDGIIREVVEETGVPASSLFCRQNPFSLEFLDEKRMLGQQHSFI
uniref:Nudix hydrolase domain-containing protein n=1 Tax=Aegilops tauschii subsp. strangulata TaxID=200361 RepID=A0A452XQB5_AEGTS